MKLVATKNESLKGIKKNGINLKGRAEFQKALKIERDFFSLNIFSLNKRELKIFLTIARRKINLKGIKLPKIEVVKKDRSYLCDGGDRELRVLQARAIKFRKKLK